ncbi:MAG: transcriptional regulator [Muribaculaceae bacterium]|nr:transcriptional regulator [Muribaculaceae bacterium]
MTLMRIFILVSALCLASATAAAQSSARLIARLDSLLERREALEQHKLSRIADLRAKRNAARSDEERYWTNDALYAELRTFNADSAMAIINENTAIARRLDKPEWLTRLTIRRSFVLAASGLLAEARDVIREINPEDISPELAKEYYQQMVYLYSHLGNFAGSYSSEEGQRYYAMERTYKDSLASISEPNDIEYLWNTGWNSQDDHNGGRRPVIEQLEQSLASSRLNSLEDAKNSYILGILHKNEGDMEGYLQGITMSAIADISISNRDIASLHELAQYMYECGDIERAYAYADYCMTAAISYPNRVRAMNIMPLQRDITRAAAERLDTRNRSLTTLLGVAALLALGLMALVVVTARQAKQLRRRSASLNDANAALAGKVDELHGVHAQLAEANSRLKELNESLRDKNESLAEANYVKEEYIGYVFAICSQYIRKIDDFRRTVGRKLTAKQYADIKQMTDAPSRMRDELKEFYQNFDSIFLHIYPDFIDDFNTLMLPDHRITPREGELLNTELRIYALVRLGITDSVKIAEFLHCSPQTVYNNRFRVRSNAAIPREVFADTVRQLGRMAKN